MPDDITSGMLSAAQLQAPLDNLPQQPDAVKYTPTPDELASAAPVASAPVKYTPTADELASAHPVQAQGPNVIQAMTPDQLVAEAKANPKQFDPLSAYQALPADQQLALHDKMADVYHQLRQSGTYTPSLMDMLQNAGKGVADLVKTVADLGERAVEAPVTLPTILKAQATGQPLDTSTFSGALAQAEQQRAGEFLAGQKMSALGLGGMLTKAANWAGRKLHIEKSLADYTDEDKSNALNAELAVRHGMADIVKNGIDSDTAKQLAAKGYAMRPEKIEQASSGSPFAWEGAGKLFGGATKLVTDSAAPLLATIAGDTTPEGIATAQAAINSLPTIAGNVTSAVAGRAVQAAGKAIEKGANLIEPLAPTLGKAAGAVGGAVTGHHLGGLGGVALGVAEGFKRGGEFGEAAETGLGKIATKAADLADMGKQIATGEGINSGLAQAGRDITQALPTAVAHLGAGAGLDAGLMAATTETPNERANFTPFGTIFGGIGGAKEIAGRTLSGQIIAPRDWGTAGTPTRPDNFAVNFPALDVEHNAAYAAAPEGIKQRFNAIQKYVDGAAPGTQVIYAPRPATGEDTLPASLQQSGIDPAWADQNGFTVNAPGPDGNLHRLVIVRDIDAAPHEARHAMDDVIGSQAVESLNNQAKQDYAENWDAFKQQYADRLAGQATTSPNDIINDQTGWGDAAAKEKIIARTRDAMEQEGMAPTDAEVRDSAAGAIRAEQGRADQAGMPLWKFSLSPEEQAHVADQYTGSEVRAEHADAWFKAGQPGTMRGKMGMMGARMLQAFGINPLAGRTSDYGTPLEGSLVSQAQQTAPTPAPEVKAPAPEGSEAANQQNVVNAQRAAQSASSTPVPGANKSPQEILGIMSEAIARKQGVKLTGLFAPDEPAASLTSNRDVRRAMIEAYRTMPDASKKLWGKLFFPENVPVTGRGNLQIFGWSPEVYAANAHKVAGALNALADKGSNLSPYELDPVTKSFTEKGWQDLYDDTQRFVANQSAGRTGSGIPLVVPESVRAAGGFAPAARGESAPLAQDKADFINMLFNAKLPDTGLARQGAINLPLNVAGQKISEATLPGRIEAPARPRGTFRGAVAQRQGVRGAPILEVNPFRNKMESALLQNKIDLPEMIEVNQRLNLKNIKDAELAPEQGNFRANTLTLQAGFQPRESADWAARQHEAEGQTIDARYDFVSRLPTQTGKDEEGFTKTLPPAYSESRNPDQFLSDIGGEKNLGRADKARFEVWKSRFNDQAAIEAARPEGALTNKEVYRQIDQYHEGVNARLRKFGPMAFQPKSARELSDFLDTANPEDYRNQVMAYSGAHGGGQTGMSFDTGTNVRTPEDLAILQSARTKFEGLAKQALQASPKDFQSAIDASSRAQAAREAIEAATDTGGAGDFIRKYYNPDYKGPLAAPAADELHAEQVNFQPNLPKGLRATAVKDADTGEVFEGPRHFYVHQQMLQNGYKPLDLFRHPQGFVDNEGNFLDRRQAMKRALEMGQLRTEGFNNSKIPEGELAAERSTIPGPTPEQQAEGARFIRNMRGQAQPRQANQDLRDVAADYMGDRPYTPHTGYAPVNETQAKAIADAYQEAQHDPENPEVKASYNAFKNETLDQWNALQKAGYKMEPWTGEGQPYANSAEMAADVRNNKHLWYFPTAAGYGEGEATAAHPMLEQTSQKDTAGNPLIYNDAFRAVHDAFGHAKEGYEFGPRGEYNAYLAHAPTYSDEARPAMAAETVGQNSWVNFGAHLRDENGNIPRRGEPGFIPPQERPFAEQKATTLNPASFQPKQKASDWELKPGASQFTKAWILPDGRLAQFGGQWHHDWLNEHPEIRKKYGIPVAPSAEEADKSRIPAMKKGFARVNYDKFSGLLTVEARKHDWPDILPSVQNLVGNNLTKFDRMRVILFNGKVNDIADDETARMFDIPKEQRVASIPFSTTGGGTVPTAQEGEAGEAGSQQVFNRAARSAFGTGQAQPVKLAPKPEEFAHTDTLETALAKPNWTIFTATQEALGKGTDKVNELANDNLEKALIADGYNPVPVSGSYKGIDQGKNFLVTGMTPDEALDWGRRYKQESVLTPNGLLYADGSIQPPDATQTKIGPEAEKQDYFSRVEGGPAFSLGFEDKVRPREEQETLGNLGAKQPLSSKQVGEMTKAQLAAHYPESVVPRAKDDAIESNIVGSPLAKEAGSRPAAIKAFADKLADFAKSVQKSTGYQAGLKWYSEFTPRLKKVYGKHAQMMAELLAATSPNNAPDTNFAFANDALQGYLSGRFEKQISQFEKGLKKIEDGSWQKWYQKEIESGAEANPAQKPSAAGFLAHWIKKYDLNPRQSNGQLYSMHSVPVLQVFARRWLENTAGPKTQNFVKNLLGTGNEATIDVWADRTMRRLGYADHQARWRILPKNGTGVSDEDFAFSQEAFREAAKQLGVTPDALQGGLWFAEKQLWADNGWGRLDLGDYRKEIAKADLLKSGIAQRLATQKAKAEAVREEQPDLLVSPR